MKRTLSVSLLLASLLAASSALAGVVGEENKYTGDQSAWTITNDGTAARDAVVDVYPAKWSVRSGESISLKVRSTAGYTAKVFRLGWYGGGGAKPVTEKGGGADAQPYPSTATEEYKNFGLLPAGWHDSITFDTTGWLPGMYWVRVDQSGTGKQAATYFVVREKAGEKWPILMLMPMNTEEGYNAWPGKERGGKSIYAWNSGGGYPVESIGIEQAVKVSFDRPFLVGAGTGDFTNYQYPAIRFVERFGYDVAYATDMDVDADPSILEGRKAVMLVGHSEYWTRKNYDSMIAARDKGVSLLSLSGDTINWQVRYENDYKTMVAFKENANNSCPRDIDGCARKNGDGTCQFALGECAPDYFKSQTKDPEAVAGYEALKAGDIEGAKKHFELVTTHWNTLFNNSALKIDVRRPGLFLTGVQTAGIIQRPDGWGFPWCDFVISGARSWWLYEGVTCDRIPGVGGYEIDSAATADRYYDPWRPTAGKGGVEIGQKRIAGLIQAWDGKTRGSASYYRMTSGAEVVALSAMGFSWGLDDFAAKQNGASKSESPCAQRMVQNALNRWLGGATAPPTFGGGDAGVDEPIGDSGLPKEPGAPGTSPDSGVAINQGAVEEAQASGCGCQTPGAAVMGGSALASLAALAGLSLLRSRRRR